MPHLKEIMIRLASAVWHGGLKDGIGIISTESGVLKQTPYSVGTRFGGQPVTSPEELIAAAHAGCFSMALSAELGKAGLIPENIRTAAGLTMERLENSWTVTQIHLDVTVKLVKPDRDKFETAANAAKAGCTISRLLNTKITMDAKLENAEKFSKTARKPDLVQSRKLVVPGSRREKFEFHVSNNSSH
jgi:lipoyl-dependent peroxiredoxin